MFGTSGIRGPIGETVTAALALSVGRAVGSTDIDRAVIGRDPRHSGEILSDAVSAGLRECGVDVIDIGLAATPTIARSVAWRGADTGISVTASHNPPADNGLKLWQPTGQAFDESRRAEITGRVEAENYDLATWDGIGNERSWDGATERHAEALVDASTEVSDCSVVVDIGTGAGGVTATALHRLGCAVETINAQPDGSFPARPSEPTEETLTSLRAQVATTDADLGVAHDGDADRLVAVDETGRFVSGDRLLALFAREAVSRGDEVAAPVNTSLAVDDTLEPLGASVTRTRVGDVHVAERATSETVVFGGEPSGAWIWPDETLCPDGPLAACKLAELVDEAGPLSSLLEAVERYPIRRESIETDAKGTRMSQVRDHVVAAYDDITTIDGVRIGFDDGWVLIRASGTQPLIRLTAEARDPDRADDLLDTARSVVSRAEA